MPEKIHVSKADVAQIIAQWWADYAAAPEKFTDGPDLEGRSSADIFFAYAEQLGIR